MLKKVLLPLVAAGLWGAVPAFGSEMREYCNDLYPVDSYEPEERAQYVQECLAQYADDDAYQEEPAAEPEPEQNYYDGTVEDYVEDVAPQEPE